MTFDTYTLGDLVSIKYGKNQKKVLSDTGTVPIYGTGGLMGYATEALYDKPSVLIGRKGTIERIRYVDHPFWTVDTLFYTIVNESIVVPQFLYYTMLQLDLLQYNEGTTIPSLRTETLNRIELQIPSIDNQKRILRYLATIDNKIALNTAINENLEQQIQAILLNMIQQDSKKDSIETVKLGEYLYIKGRIGWKGLKKDEYLDSSDYRIINGESLTKDGIDWNKAGFISKERYDESPEIMLQVGDILLSKDGTIGKIGYVDNLDSPSTVASGIFVIRNIKPNIISTQFIYYLLKSKLFSAFIASRTEGSVIPHLYQKDFMEFAFPLPNADEMSQFDALTSPLFATIIKNLRENEFLTATRDALLPKLMSGEIDVSAVKI